MVFWSAMTEEKYHLLFHDLLRYMAEFYINMTDFLEDCFRQEMVSVEKSRNFYCYIIANMAKEFMCSEKCKTQKASLITNALSEFRVEIYGGNLEKCRAEESFYDSAKTIDELVDHFVFNCISSEFLFRDNIKTSMKEHSLLLFRRVFFVYR